MVFEIPGEAQPADAVPVEPPIYVSGIKQTRFKLVVRGNSKELFINKIYGTYTYFRHNFVLFTVKQNKKIFKASSIFN